MPQRDLTTIFVHIPKTAGTTLYHVLDRNYRFAQTYSIREVDTTIEDFGKLPEAARAKYRLVRGHMPWGQHRNVPGPSSYFTMLRDPVDRIVSIYYFLINNPLHYLYDAVKSQKLDLKGYVSARLSQDTANFQVRCLSGAWYHVPYGECTQGHLDEAKQHIEQYFDVVGFTEYFDASLLLLQRYYGWYWPWYTSARVNSKRPAEQVLDADTLAVIREHNLLDIALYEWALLRFQEQVKALGPDFQMKLNRFPVMNRRLAPLVHLYQASRRVSVRTGLRNLVKFTAKP